METQRLTETELIERAKYDLEAFGELVERYRNLIVRQCRSRVKDRDWAEDLAQETFIRAYLKLGQLQDLTRFPNWLRKIASNVCSEFLRSPNRREWAWDVVPEVEETYVPSEMGLRLNLLPEKTRRCVELFYDERLSILEVAQTMGMTAGSVRGRLQRAKKVLKKEMADMAPAERSDFTERVIEKLEQLKDSDVKARADAAKSLHQALAEDRVEWMVGLLRHPDPMERSPAIKSSRKYRSPRVKDALVDALLHDEWEENRMKAAGALAAQRDPSVIPALRQAMDDPGNPQEVVSAAKSTIKLLETLESPENVETEKEQFRRDVESAASDKKARVEILRELKSALKDPDSGVRNKAIKALQELGDKRAVAAIAKMLDDPVSGVRGAVATALGVLKSPAAIPALDSFIKKSNDRFSVQAAARSLREIGDPSALPAVLQTVEKDNFIQLFMMSVHMGVIDDLATPDNLYLVKQAIDRFYERTRDQSNEWHNRVSWVLPRCLARHGDERHVDEMIAQLERWPDHLIRRELIAGLGRIGDMRAVDVLREQLSFVGDPRREPHVAPELAAEALAKLGEPGMKTLRESLYSDDPNVRAAAAHGIACEGGDRESKAKLEDLSKNDSVTRVRFNAKKALRATNSEKKIC